MNIYLTTRTCALALIPGLLAALLIQACGGGFDAVAQATSEADPVEGAWQSAVTVRDCTTGAVSRSFIGLTVLHRGGTATATNNLPPAGNGPAVGSWKRGNTVAGYTTTLRFFRFNADGSFAGAQNLTRTFTLAADGKSLTGTLSAQVVDPADVVLLTTCGTETAVRVAVS
ncbi:MAG: hypothetical protein M3Z29_08015 [Pseudomonadota bacterium]|nr:hypothetical protein [Pseudomonadota bacterium]